MTGLEPYLPLIWAGILATAVGLYVILDGFDLGLGILFFTTRDETARDDMMSSVAPFWDGNETWLVLGGGGLLAAFPLAYSIIMPALYIPIILMLLALILRGVAFEFRWAAKPWHGFWDVAFAGGSTLAALAQGFVLGGLIQGITVKDNAFAGGPFDWFSPFALLCGFGLVAGYGLLACCWLLMKTSGGLAAHARRLALPFLLAVVFCAAVVSIWTPLRYPAIAERWFSTPNIFYLWPLPAATGALAFLVFRALRRGDDFIPFFGVVGIFLLCFAGLAISAYPYLVPHSIDLWQAAGAPESLKFMLIGVSILLPVILGYTIFVYWTFRGRLRVGEGYH
ncbi:cytochrome d ubiquinol oxidase subunit II [Beijerinckia indica]|uniref:Cytochrome d ubiquinol oxidase, subunit II n=1 Tax=Beijerinckia indica subsp. indica (strain ATCC 9039 / DSM 1715 / NCIMB 8712) TaxID=395963 RepID=B2IDR4_BEII9|nr:cytochrome d ubiquinol oxidase subunit II [Beijerinckia indica]ACB96846.1 cytochrome d ubiquinol oxidase, subunit II [Beijerinckia indica subsp. indica ATCC 9039]